MYLNYWQICQALIKNLSEKQKRVISCRFGLISCRRAGKGRRETLSSIGKKLGVTRERIRQIEKDGMLEIKAKSKEYQKISQYFTKQLKKTGGLRREDILLEELGEEKWQNHVYFLLTIGDNFERFGESKDFYSLWAVDKNSLALAQKTIDFFVDVLEKTKKPMKLNELVRFSPLNQGALVSYLDISKKIQQNSKGLFGLRDWPEINPRGIKDKVYLTLKDAETPLHFNKIAALIGENALPQTVHNELIKDQRFVLVGRGIYALKDWGYYPGRIREIIFKSLEEAKRPLSREEILEKVLKQRLVKENTILLNLSNKKYFLKTDEGHYTIKPTTIIEEA